MKEQRGRDSLEGVANTVAGTTPEKNNSHEFNYVLLMN